MSTKMGKTREIERLTEERTLRVLVHSQRPQNTGARILRRPETSQNPKQEAEMRHVNYSTVSLLQGRGIRPLH